MAADGDELQQKPQPKWVDQLWQDLACKKNQRTKNESIYSLNCLSDSEKIPAYSFMERVLSLSALKVGINWLIRLLGKIVAVLTDLKSLGAAISWALLNPEIFFRLLGM